MFVPYVIVGVVALLALTIVGDRRLLPFVVMLPICIGDHVIDRSTGLTVGSVAQKALILLLLAFATLILGIGKRWFLGVTMVAIFVVAALVTVASQPILSDVGTTRIVLGTLGYSYYWFAFLPAWERIPAKSRAFSLAILPLTALLIDVTMALSGMVELTRDDTTPGVARLAGTLFSAHFGALAMFGTIGACWLWLLGGRTAGALVAVNLAICAATFTRGTLLVAGLCTVVTLFSLARRSARPVGATIGVVGGAAALLAVMAGPILERMHESGLSGREFAWPYYWRRFTERPWTGYGWGETTALADLVPGDWFRQYFTAPHNTYLQLLVEGGLLGGIAVALALVIVSAQVFRHATGTLRPVLACMFVSLVVFSFFDNLLTAVQASVGLAMFLALAAADDSTDDPLALAKGTDVGQDAEPPRQVPPGRTDDPVPTTTRSRPAL